MIRIFNLFCKLKKIKISDQEWLDQAFHHLNLSEQPCLYCNSKENSAPLWNCWGWQSWLHIPYKTV